VFHRIIHDWGYDHCIRQKSFSDKMKVTFKVPAAEGGIQME
jgi:hypothetical protein